MTTLLARCVESHVRPARGSSGPGCPLRTAPAVDSADRAVQNARVGSIAGAAGNRHQVRLTQPQIAAVPLTLVRGAVSGPSVCAPLLPRTGDPETAQTPRTETGRTVQISTPTSNGTTRAKVGRAVARSTTEPTVASRRDARKGIDVNVHSFPQQAQDAANHVRVLIKRARHPQSPGGTEIVPCEERVIEEAVENSYLLASATNHGFRVAQAAFRVQPERMDDLTRERNRVVAMAPLPDHAA